MKKYATFFITLFVSLLLASNKVKAYEVTHTTLDGDITFDVEQIARENNVETSGNYILFKRKTSDETLLILEPKDSKFFYKHAEEAIVARKNNVDQIIFRLKYNTSTKKFEKLDYQYTGIIFLSKDVYFDSSYSTSFEIDYDFLKKIMEFDKSVLTEQQLENYNKAMEYFDLDNVVASGYDYFIRTFVTTVDGVRSRFLQLTKMKNSTDFKMYFSISSYTSIADRVTIYMDTNYGSPTDYSIKVYNLDTNKLMSNSSFSTSSWSQLFYFNFDLKTNNIIDSYDNGFDIVCSSKKITLDPLPNSNYKYIGSLKIKNGEDIYILRNNDFIMNEEGKVRSPIPTKKDYTYQNLIDTTNVDKIEFNFKDLYKKDFNLELQTTSADRNLPKPYLQTKSTYNGTDISQIDDFLGDIEPSQATDINGNEIYEYSGTYGINYLDIKELKLVFDVSAYTGEMYIGFVSSFGFDVNIISNTQEVQDYYKMVSMNDVYGIYLIPKTLNNDNFTNIKLNGVYNIEVRNNYTNSNDKYEVLEKYLNYNKNNFQYLFNFDKHNYLIYLENTKYNTSEDDSYFVKIDTRYYNYSIKKFIYDSPTIINPNTNQDITINGDDTIDKNQEHSLKDYIGSSTKFMNSMKEFILIPATLCSFFFNELNPYIQMTIITIFIILVVVGVASIIKK